MIILTLLNTLIMIFRSQTLVNWWEGLKEKQSTLILWWKLSNWCQRIIMYFDNRKIDDSKKHSGQMKMVVFLMATKFTCSLTNFSFTHEKAWFKWWKNPENLKLIKPNVATKANMLWVPLSCSELWFTWLLSYRNCKWNSTKNPVTSWSSHIHPNLWITPHFPSTLPILFQCGLYLLFHLGYFCWTLDNSMDLHLQHLRIIQN